jgi:hypothetical protein
LTVNTIIDSWDMDNDTVPYYREDSG